MHMAEKSANSPQRKWIEPVVAVLMALTTLCTAWCSYESAAWTRRSNRLMNESNSVERRAALLDVQGSQALIHPRLNVHAAPRRAACRQRTTRELLCRAFSARREEGLRC